MSGIVGVWNLDSAPVARIDIERMNATLIHRGPDGGSTWLDRDIALGARINRVVPESVTERQPFLGRSGSVCVFDGRLDDREELMGALEAERALDRAPDPELVLAAYEKFGNSFVARLNGDFALAIFDPRYRRLILARDAIGLRPLYFLRTARTFLFASEVKAFLSHPTVVLEPNADQLADYLLRLNNSAGEGLTFFEGVYAVRPAHLAVVTRERTVTEQYWEFPEDTLRFRSFDGYVEAFQERFRVAVRRRLRSRYPVAVSVSGGLDSSSIYGMAQEEKRLRPGSMPEVAGISYVSSDGSLSDEHAYITDLERHFGTAIHKFPVTFGFLDGCGQQAWHSETPLPETQWKSLESLMTIARHEKNARVLLMGHWGDQVMFDEAYLVDLARQFSFITVWKHLREIPRWYTDADPSCFRRRFFRTLARSFVPEKIMPWLRAARRTVSSHWPGSPWYSASFRQRTTGHSARRKKRLGGWRADELHRRIRSPYDGLAMDWQNKIAASAGLEAAFPFLDRELLSFTLSLPPAVQSNGGVPRALLREAMRHIIPATIVDRRWKSDYSSLEHHVLRSEMGRVVSLLDSAGSEAVRRGFLRNDAQESISISLNAADATDPNCEPLWAVADAVGLENWLRVFWKEPVNANFGVQHA